MNLLEGHSSNPFLSSCNKIQNLQHILTVRGDLKIETKMLIENSQSQIATVDASHYFVLLKLYVVLSSWQSI